MRAWLIVVGLAAGCAHHAAAPTSPAGPSPIAEVAQALIDQHDRGIELPDNLVPRARARAGPSDRALLDLLVVRTLEQRPDETLEMFALREDIVQARFKLHFLVGVLGRRDNPSLDRMHAELTRLYADLEAATTALERKLAAIPPPRTP